VDLGGEEGISFRFERASSKLLLLENSVIFVDVSKAMTSPLSFALSPLSTTKKNKKNVWHVWWVLGVLFRQKMRRKKTQN